LGNHANRARLYKINGDFLTAIPNAEGERLVDFGQAEIIEQTPLRIKLLAPRTWQPKPKSPTSDCTGQACITHTESEFDQKPKIMRDYPTRPQPGTLPAAPTPSFPQFGNLALERHRDDG